MRTGARRAWVGAIVATAITGCGGGGGGETAAPVLTGRFFDAAVEGIDYQTLDANDRPGESGRTDAEGRFRYRAGDRVVFSIGSLSLPAATAASVVTPLDLAGSRKLDDPKVSNLLVLLQSLDADGDPTNGIKIPAAAATALTPTQAQTLSQALLKQQSADFAALPDLLTLVRGATGQPNRAPVAISQAQQHFLGTARDQLPEALVIASVVPERFGGTAPTGDSNFRYKQASEIRFTGSGLSAGLTAEATGACTSMERISASATDVVFRCTPSAVGPIEVKLKRGTEVLASFSEQVALPQVAIQTVVAERFNGSVPQGYANFRYKEPSSLRFVGTGFTDLLTAEVTGACNSLEQVFLTATDAVYRCTPQSVGPIAVRLKYGGEVISRFDEQVTLPRVRFEVSTYNTTSQSYDPARAFLVELEPAKAPITTNNFLRYVDAQYYDSTVFHRVYPGFMVQAGGFNFANGQYVDKPSLYDPIALERTTLTNLSNTAFTVAMARTRVANSATSEFFINVADNSASLDTKTGSDGYAVFGRLVADSEAEENETIALLNAILNVQKVSNGFDSVPTRPVTPPVINRAVRTR